MKVLIIEDEAPAFRRLQKMLETLDPAIEIVEVIDSVQESVKWLKNHDQFDLVFMDIQLSDGISFEIFEQLKITKPVIFTTAFDDYMLKAFKVNSVDYLLKPIKEEELEKSLQKFRELKKEYGFQPVVRDLSSLINSIQLHEKAYKTRFLIKQGDKLLSIEVTEISYFQLHNGLVYLHTSDQKQFIMNMSLNDLDRQLDPQNFFRANRQFIINFPAVKAVHRYHKGKLLLELVQETQPSILISSEAGSSLEGMAWELGRSHWWSTNTALSLREFPLCPECYLRIAWRCNTVGLNGQCE